MFTNTMTKALVLEATGLNLLLVVILLISMSGQIHKVVEDVGNNLNKIELSKAVEV